ncbi:gamma subclass chorismate mutase AroQ [Streptomyces benahoarensis]|uniref:chorismate mutase n=1 Tax=Streptomyces benahoarensis TaxID=2595054 RepID=A0A553Z8A1_9ACTN|nr:gamma subclass chorismate mutase AroQ [Streptomyces benahoarensis]
MPGRPPATSRNRPDKTASGRAVGSVGSSGRATYDRRSRHGAVPEARYEKGRKVQLIPSIRRLLPAAASAVLLLAGAGGAQAATTTAGAHANLPHAAPAPGAPPPAGAFVHSPYRQLRPLAALSAERAALGDLVAAAKWGTGAPIDDPAREREVLDAAAAQARRLGADPEVTRRIFRDQIEASKTVQRGLYRAWEADPARAPRERPDLAKVRTEINRVNDALVRAVAASPHARSAPYCPVVLGVVADRVRHEERLDALHTRALGRAVRSVCGG